MQSKAYIPKGQKGNSCRKTYSVVLNKRHAVIVDKPNFKGPNLGHFIDDNPSEIVHTDFLQSKANHYNCHYDLLKIIEV